MNPSSNVDHIQIRLRRLYGLIRKEFLQIIRDPSSILIAFVLPVLLLFLFGYGVSLDLEHIPIGIVAETQSPEVTDLISVFKGSPTFRVYVVRHRKDIQNLLVGGQLSAVLVIPSDFSKNIANGQSTSVQVLIRGTDANTAALVRNSIETAWKKWLSFFSHSSGGELSRQFIHLEPRIWFNEEMESRATLLPGSIAVIMTLIGTMLTSLVIAREWERGTMEALLSTPVTRLDVFFGKFIPYFVLGLTAMLLVTGVSTWVMGVSFRGSVFLLLLVSSSFLSFALGLGLTISAVTRNQFLATQIALIVGFLPSFLLSGLVFEIKSMPFPIRMLTYLFPPRYFVTALRTLFLAGNIPSILLPNMLILSMFAFFFLALSIRKIQVRLET